MRKLVCFALLCVGISASAQLSNVTGTVTDTDSQTWNNGAYQITFVPPTGYTGSVYTFNGSAWTPSVHNGVMNGTGVLTYSALERNDYILPANSHWKFTVCPNASFPCTSRTITINQASQSISSQFNAVQAPRFAASNAQTGSFGYLDVEVSPGTPPIGSSYFNVTLNQPKLWNGTTWQTGGGGSATPGGTSTNVQFNDSGVLGGNGNFTFDKNTGIVNIDGVLGNTAVTIGPHAPPASSWTLDTYSPSTAFGSIVPGATVTGTGNTQVAQLPGNVTALSLTATGLGTSTSPVCPNGSGGALTRSGCALNTLSTLSAVQTGTDNTGNVKSIEAWQRQGIAIAPRPTDASQQVQEVSAILDSNPEILSSATYSQVVKRLFTCGWWPVALGGAGINICYDESPDGVTAGTRYAGNPLITNHARSFLMPQKVGSNYVLYASDMSNGGNIDVYTGTTIAGLTRTQTNVLHCGGNGSERTNGYSGMVPFVISGNHWRAFYDCQLTDFQYVVYLADSVDAGVTWTKVSTTPVIGESSPITCGGLCYEGGGEYAQIINGVLNVWGHFGPNGATPGIPTPYIWHFTDSSASPGQNLVADASPAMQAQTTVEGVNTKAGQFADPYLLDMGSLGKSILYATSYTNGCSAQALCSLPAYITASTINQPLATVVTGTQIDNSQSVAAPLAEVNGAPLSRRDVMNFTGSAISDSGNGSIAINVPTTAWVLGASGAPTTIASDSFIRATGALGSNWTGSANLTITSSGLGNLVAGATTDDDWYTGATFNANQCSTVTVQTLPNTGLWFLTSVRRDTSAGYSMLAFNNSGDITFYLYKFSGGTIAGTVIAGPVVQTGQHMALNDTYGVCISGTIITGQKNGVAIPSVTATDSTFAGPGFPGVGLPAGNRATRLTNFVASNLTIPITTTLGGSALSVGCTNGTTVTVTGATTAMACVMTGVAGNPTNIQPQCAVTTTNTVTPALCTAVATTPTSQVYNIRVIP
jgi:hypothetical protein